MVRKPTKFMELNKDAYDFSLECAAFRQKLFEKLMERTNDKNTILLSDEELLNLNAAGKAVSSRNSKNNKIE